MFTSELIKKLKKKYPSLTKNQLLFIFRAIFVTIESSLLKHDSVELRKFGRWSIRETKERYNAKNPKTGKNIFVPRKKKVFFKMAMMLKKNINN